MRKLVITAKLIEVENGVETVLNTITHTKDFSDGISTKIVANVVPGDSYFSLTEE